MTWALIIASLVHGVAALLHLVWLSRFDKARHRLLRVARAAGVYDQYVKPETQDLHDDAMQIAGPAYRGEP